ncbi:MAG: spore photoproduct lyase family protein [Bacillota bacterium]
MVFVPRVLYVQKAALSYPRAARAIRILKKKDVPVVEFSGRLPLGHTDDVQRFFLSKRSLVLSVRKPTPFATCRPSADYQLPLASGCPGLCEYCYLHTALGLRSYLRVYVNLEETLSDAARLMEASPEPLRFEGAATSDPLPAERYTGVLADTISFFAGCQAWFRFVTKSADIEPLFGIRHAGRTTVRFSVNAERYIGSFEHGTAGLLERLSAAHRLRHEGYPVGLLVAPVFLESGWEDAYLQLIRQIKKAGLDGVELEFVTHRFTARARENIRRVFPHTNLPMQEEGRRYRRGQFGYGKYVYDESTMSRARDVMLGEVARLLPRSRVLYFV